MRNRKWTEEQVAQMGTMPDTRLGRQLGISPGLVGYNRRKAGIPVYKSTKK